MILDRKVWLTADKGEVVEDGDPRAAFLLGNEGVEIPDDEAKRLGLAPRVEQPVDEEEAAPADAKQADQPEDKQADAPANKASSLTTTRAKRG